MITRLKGRLVKGRFCEYFISEYIGINIGHKCFHMLSLSKYPKNLQLDGLLASLLDWGSLVKMEFSLNWANLGPKMHNEHSPELAKTQIFLLYDFFFNRW